MCSNHLVPHQASPAMARTIHKKNARFIVDSPIKHGDFPICFFGMLTRG